MPLIVDDDYAGATYDDWRRRLTLDDVPMLDRIRARRVVIVAPHPDDEVFGTGGLIQRALRDRILVEIVVVSDGEASHPRSPTVGSEELANRRFHETRVAHRRLGIGESSVTHLHLPDGSVGEHRARLADALSNIVLPDDLCVAPWSNDGHPDHDVTGATAEVVSRNVGAAFLSSLVWTWHWADPFCDDVPWERAARLNLSRRERARKRWASAAYQSQVKALSPSAGDEAVLPPSVLKRFWGPTEIYLRAGNEQ